MRLPELPAAMMDFKPEVGLVLGSGWGFFAEKHIEAKGRLDYGEIQGFPLSIAPGHAGRFVYGHVGGRRVLCMQGRFHFYEGHTMSQLASPIRLMAGLGIRHLFLTNAAGGLRPEYRPGDLMLIRDHINFLGGNPLIGWREADGGFRFSDMTDVYDAELRAAICQWASTDGMELKEGVYLATAGPCFETPAEVRAFAALGADAVGMSTVPEAIVARRQGLRVVGLSCIANAAAGLSKTPIRHDEVEAAVRHVRPSAARLLEAAIALTD